jgi:hypothetical protein
MDPRGQKVTDRQQTLHNEKLHDLYCPEPGWPGRIPAGVSHFCLVQGVQTGFGVTRDCFPGDEAVGA